MMVSSKANYSIQKGFIADGQVHECCVKKVIHITDYAVMEVADVFDVVSQVELELRREE